MDARILVLVFDLTAALLHALRYARLVVLAGAEEGHTLRLPGRIAQPADGGGEIAGGLGARIEVLVELLIGRHENRSVLPVDTAEVLLALEPHERVAVPNDAHDVEA